MCVMLFLTINDFYAYGNLVGYSVKIHKVCPIYESNIYFYQFQFGEKTVYLRNCKFLKPNHPYCRSRKAFNGEHEFEIALKPLTSDEVYQRQEHLTVIFGKNKKFPVERNIWKNRSLFFDLPYWHNLDVRYCLDVIHVEKNMCDSLIGTLLNILCKTKYSKNSHLDMVDMGIRQKLAPEERGKIVYLPPTCHTLSKKKKESLCE